MKNPPAVCRVLLVDDETPLRTLLRLMLHRTDRYEVVGEAADGHQALALAATVRPGLVLLDLAMPQMGGLETLPHLRQLVPDAHVLVLSGFASDSAADVAMGAGAHGYLEKGLAPNKLIEAIDRALDRTSA